MTQKKDIDLPQALQAKDNEMVSRKESLFGVNSVCKSPKARFCMTQNCPDVCNKENYIIYMPGECRFY